MRSWLEAKTNKAHNEQMKHAASALYNFGLASAGTGFFAKLIDGRGSINFSSSIFYLSIWFVLYISSMVILAKTMKYPE